NIGPAVFRGDAAGVFANDQGDFAFISEQLGAGRTFDGRAGGCDRRGGLQKVAWEFRVASALFDAGWVVQVQGNNFARTVLLCREVKSSDVHRDQYLHGVDAVIKIA